MRMRWIINLVLAALLLAMGLLIRHEIQLEARPETLSGLNQADLRLIELTREGEPKVRLERTPDGWRMVEPMAVQGDESRVERLLGLLEAPVHRSFPAASADLPGLGLLPATIQLKLDSLDLTIGGLDPIGERRYVATGGLVHLIDDRFHHLLIGAPIDWVSRFLLPPGSAPAFGTLSGVPLAAETLAQLAKVEAERVEPLTGELAGDAARLKYADGTALRFLVSEDRRRWSRLDLKIRYVLGEPPELMQDPTAVDTTPPPPAPVIPPEPEQPTVEYLPMPGEVDGQSMIPVEAPDPADPFAPFPDPDAPVTEEDMSGAPPEVRLTPEGTYGPGADYGTEPGFGFGDEPYKERPQGFGADPFAPDPMADPNADPNLQGWSPDEP